MKTLLLNIQNLKIMKTLLLIALVFGLTKLNAQDTTKTTISGYTEVYYSYDFSNPVNHERPSFFYNFNRHNQCNNKLAFAVRGEYYYDKNGIIIATGTPNGFQTFGYSLNLDYAIRDNILWRIEGRGLNSHDKIFTMNNNSSNQNYFITTSLAFSF